MPAAGATVSPLGGQASFRTLGRRPITRRANASSALLVGVGVSRPRAPASAEPADARERAFRAAAREHRVRITSEQADIWPSDSSAKPGEKQWPGAFFLSLSLTLSLSLILSLSARPFYYSFGTPFANELHCWRARKKSHPKIFNGAHLEWQEQQIDRRGERASESRSDARRADDFLSVTHPSGPQRERAACRDGRSRERVTSGTPARYAH